MAASTLGVTSVTRDHYRLDRAVGMHPFRMAADGQVSRLARGRVRGHDGSKRLGWIAGKHGVDAAAEGRGRDALGQVMRSWPWARP